MADLTMFAIELFVFVVSIGMVALIIGGSVFGAVAFARFLFASKTGE